MRINLFIFLLLTTGGCTKVFNISGYPPSKSSFKYYDPDFEFPVNTVLIPNEYYISQGKELESDTALELLVFFKDGFVNDLSTYYLPDKMNYKTPYRAETGGEHGYYKIKDDSIWFSVDAYYRSHPIYYRGEIISNGDSIILIKKYKINWWKKWQEKEERYVIFEKWKYNQ